MKRLPYWLLASAVVMFEIFGAVIMVGLFIWAVLWLGIYVLD